MTTIKDAPVVEQLIGTEKFPISDGSGKPVTATIQQIIDKCGIPLVEELDSDAPLGTLVRYKQDISFDKIETANKTTEEITKVVPYIKQQHGWESLITETSDFNNDFNFDFN